MGADCRPGTALLAAGVIGGAVALALRGVARTAVPDAIEDGGALLGPRVRAWYRGVLAPFEEDLAAAGVSPDALTYAQLGVSVLAGIGFATGCVFLAGWLTILAGTLDILDGGVARRSGRASARGAFTDSVVDRWAEFATFFGLGVLFRASWACGAVAIAAIASQMVSYARARAEGLGIAMGVGGAQRPERYVLLGCGAWLSALVTHLGCAVAGRRTHAVLEGVVVGLAVVSGWTALERTRHARRALSGPSS